MHTFQDAVAKYIHASYRVRFAIEKSTEHSSVCKTLKRNVFGLLQLAKSLD